MLILITHITLELRFGIKELSSTIYSVLNLVAVSKLSSTYIHDIHIHTVQYTALYKYDTVHGASNIPYMSTTAYDYVIIQI